MIEISTEEVFTWATQLAVIIGSITALVVWFRKWVKKQVSDPMEKISANVNPNGGSQETSRWIIEDIHREVSTLRSDHSALAQTAIANRELGNKAVGVAEHALAIANQALDLTRELKTQILVADANNHGAGVGPTA